MGRQKLDGDKVRDKQSCMYRCALLAILQGELALKAPGLALKFYWPCLSELTQWSEDRTLMKFLPMELVSVRSLMIKRTRGKAAQGEEQLVETKARLW